MIDPSPTDAVTQVDPDTGEEWLSLGGSGAGVGDLPRRTVIPPEALAQDLCAAGGVVPGE